MYEKLDKLQQEAVNLCLSVKTLAIFAEQRTGKTWITLGLIEKLTTGDDLYLLIVPLTNKLSTWATQLSDHLPNIPIFLEWKEFKAWRKAWGGPAVLLIHYEMLTKSLVGSLRRVLWRLIVIDESQRIKNRSSRAARRIHQLRGCALFKILLTGTPMDKSPIDMWSQFKFLRDTIFGHRWKSFETEYLKPDGYMGYKRKFRKEKTNKFLKKVGPYCFRMSAADVGIDKPIIIKHFVKLKGKQAKVYNDMEEEMLAQILTDDDEVTIAAALKITRNGKLHQICGGAVLDEDGEVHWLGRVKQRKTMEIIAGLEPPFVVVCRYKHEIERLHMMLSRKYPVIKILWGKVKDKKKIKHRTNLIQSFQRGEIDGLICQIKTGGVGIDLFEADAAVVYSTTYSYIDYAQMIARLSHRDQEYPPTFHLVIVEDTIDEDIYGAMEDKEKISKRVYRRLRRRLQKNLRLAIDGKRRVR